MLVRDIFKKNIDRPIRGVIKVAQDDEESRYQELEEYVLTRELFKYFSVFYENYMRSIDGYSDEMGVWISGFFGSGKSHFLKILSYVLENREVKGKKTIDFFEDKVAEKDPLFYAEMKRAADIECETILFNIDSKSPIGMKTSKDAILRIFVKVFYEHLGYYGDDLKVAELEKYLQREGALEEFQRSFAMIKGEPWEKRRSCFLFDEDAVVDALVKSTSMSESSARNWFNYSQTTKISIEQFAQEVKAYIDSKGENFHLIFLADEVGQYIGDNSELMLNLQTVVEDLGTYCQGKVWVIVTSQEAIDTVTKVKGDDFSKIQGRFGTRLSLSSASVHEVIEKRILEKSDNAADKLRLIYDDQAATLKNLIHFSGMAADLKGYSGEEEFCATYPFVPYQFKVLQLVFNEIRKHGASGKHLSEGERSMLSAFQDAARKYADEEVGILVPFHSFYDSVHGFLDGSIQRVITRASEAALNKEGLELEDVDVLKLLFLIRYIDEDIPANIDNLATLMVSSLDEDKLDLKENIRKSLNRLISQNYVQKYEDKYRFLTDDEQDINREIRNTIVDTNEVVREIGEYIFNEIYEDRKYQYSKHYYIPFNRKIDETSIGNQTARIGLRFLTSAADDYDAGEAELKMSSSRDTELIIRLDDRSDYFEEMQEALKIENFDRSKKKKDLPANLNKIMVEKREEAGKHRERAASMLKEALLQGQYYCNGEKINPVGSSAQEKIESGLKVLVDSIYNKLPYVEEFLDNDQDILDILNRDIQQFTLTGEEDQLNHLALDEIMHYIDLQDAVHLQITMKNILDKFEDAPYGWREIDIAGMIALLFRQQKIQLQYQGSHLDLTDKGLTDYLRKKTEVEKLLIKKRVKVDEKLIRTAREIGKELFNNVNLPLDEDGLVRELLAMMQEKREQIEKDYLSHYENKPYPGEERIRQGLEIFEEIEKYKNDHNLMLTKLKDYQDDLLDWHEDMQTIGNFFRNQQPIFDKGLNMLHRIRENDTYLQEKEFLDKKVDLKAIIEEPVPYSKIPQITDLVDWLEKHFEERLDAIKASNRLELEKDYKLLSEALSQYGMDEKDKVRLEEEINSWYEDKYRYIDESTGFERVDAAISQSAKYRDTILDEIKKAIEDNTDHRLPPGDPIHDPEYHVLELKELVLIDTLSTEQEVDNYIKQLGDKLKKLIKDNKVIRFSKGEF